MLMKISFILVGGLFLVILLFSGCSDEVIDQGCDSLGCPDYQVCVENTCQCDEGAMRCGVSCIPEDACCTNDDCEMDERCTSGACINPCLNVTCEDPFVCSMGECVCPSELKLCEESCIPKEGCCSEEECAEGLLCHDNSCKTPCEIVTCGSKEYCHDGECLCKENYFRSANGVCLPEGLCSNGDDCKDSFDCVAGRCMKNCYSYSEPIEISECFLDQAELSADEKLCELVVEAKQNICYFQVAVAKLDKTLCSMVPSNPPSETLTYNQQNCVIEVAKKARNPDLCKDTPKWTSFDPPDRDAFCRQEVENFIVDVGVHVISDCESDCACRMRFAKKNDITYCKNVCSEDQSACTDYFYQ